MASRAFQARSIGPARPVTSMPRRSTGRASAPSAWSSETGSWMKKGLREGPSVDGRSVALAEGTERPGLLGSL